MVASVARRPGCHVPSGIWTLLHQAQIFAVMVRVRRSCWGSAGFESSPSGGGRCMLPQIAQCNGDL
jgi:hypothetical protein